MKLRVVNTPTGFVPETDEDAEVKRKLKRGATYEVNIKQVRNPMFNRKFHAMIRVGWEYLTEQQQEGFKHNIDYFRYHLEIESGFCDMVYDCVAQKVTYIPKSTAFDAMDEQTFERVYNGVRDLLIRRFVGAANEANFINEIKWF